MSYNLSNKLVVAISSRALFELESENKIFEEDGLDAYYKYQLDNETTPLAKGTAYRLVENLLKINNYFSKEEKCKFHFYVSSHFTFMFPPISLKVSTWKQGVK